MDSLLGLLAVFALVFTNGFFVAAEFALVGSRRTRIAQLAAEGNAAARVAQRAISNLDSFIAATQLGITLSSLALGWIGEPAIAHLIEPIFERLLPGEAVRTISATISVVIAFSFVTLLHIVLGELVPKSIALQRPESTSLVVARPVTIFLLIFRPIIYLMNGVGNAVVRWLGFLPAGEHSSVHSAEELEMLVHSSREAGLIEENEEQLLRRVFDFSDIKAEEIMQPRTEVDGIPLDATLQQLLDVVVSNHHSRYPVYQETIDNVRGLLLVKDLLDLIVRQPDLLAHTDQILDLRPLLREPLFVPAAVGVDRLLAQMQETKTHLAVVLDEYGGMAGVATMEDVIEQLVGDVRDEFDVGEIGSMEAQGDSVMVDGLLSLSEIAERFGEIDTRPESTTIGGYVSERLNRIASTGDIVRYGNYDVRVEEMDGMRVARLRFMRRHQRTPSALEQGTSHVPPASI